MFQTITYSIKQTLKFGKKIGNQLVSPCIIALKGEMGTGKTWFTKGIALGLGIKDTITSPTFSIVNVYKASSFYLYHFDMYRIMNFYDFTSTGFYDYLNEGGILIIEWSENVLEFLPNDYIAIEIKKLSENTRQITVKESNLLNSNIFKNI